MALNDKDREANAGEVRATDSKNTDSKNVDALAAHDVNFGPSQSGQSSFVVGVI